MYMRIFSQTRYFLWLALVLVAGLAALLIVQSTTRVSADIDDAFLGAAWSANAGWVSMNCVTENTCAASPYGVDVELDPYSPSYGQYDGYAWSSIYGWVDFGGGSCGTGAHWDLVGYTYNATNPDPVPVDGWGEIVAVAADPGNPADPCISLSGVAADSSTYQVTFDPDPDVDSRMWMGGYAWNNSSEGVGLGWIDFSGVYTTVDEVNLDCYVNGVDCPSLLNPSVNVSTGFSGNCADNPATVSWTTTDVESGTCDLFINGVNQGSVADSGSMNITATTSTATIAVTCDTPTGAPTSTVTDSIALSCSVPQCSNGSDDDGDGGADSLDPSCYDNCDIDTGTYDPNIMSESRSCAGTGGTYTPPIFREL